MKIQALKLPNTIETVRNIIQGHTDTFGVFLDYDRICEYIFYYSVKLNKLTKKLEELSGTTGYTVTNRNMTYNILTSRFGVPQQYFYGKSGKMSVDKDTIEKIRKEYEGSGSAVEVFLTLLQEAATTRTIVSSFKGYKDLPFADGVDTDGHRMVVAHPTWCILNTSRLSAKDPGIQTINRNLGDIITAPKGYQIVRGDSGQIEPRIMWSAFMRDELMVNLIKGYDDAYYAYYDFISMDAHREKMLRENFEKNFEKLELTDDVKEKRQQMKRMSLAAGYGSQLAADHGFDPQLARLYMEKISNHPLRKQWEARVTEAVQAGEETFYGAFGSPVTPDVTDRYVSKADQSWKNHLIRCGINNPIQTTASELMIFAVTEASKILATCLKAHIAYYKHDEGCFYIPEDRMDLAEQLGSCQSYDVLDWIPIRSETEIGRKAVHNDVVRVF